MASVSEDLSQMSMDMLLKVLNALGQLGINSVKLIGELGSDGAGALVGLLNYLENQPGAEYDAQTRRAMKKLRDACKEKDAVPLMATIEKSDLPEIEKWLKKQNLLYVACSPENLKKDTPGDELAKMIRSTKEHTATLFYMENEKSKVENASAILAYQKGYINVLPPEAFFLLHDDKKNVSVVDGLDVYELNVFRALAKQYGLCYTEMENGPAQADVSLPGTFKVVCGKDDADKMAAIMRVVAWSMTGKDAEDIKEKIKERSTIASELRALISEGVKDGQQIFMDDSGKQVKVDNAKYVVKASDAKRFVKITAKGFQRVNGSEIGDLVSKGDPDYEEKLQDALSELGDCVIVDGVAWEKDGLEKMNLRKEHILQKQSVFPPQFSVEKEESDIRKAHKKRKSQPEPIEDSVWLFHKYDPEGSAVLSEVVEEHLNAPSKPLEETVSIHYNAAYERSKKYRYFDVESDAYSVDNIILAARGRVEKDMPSEKKDIERDRK